MKTTIQWDIADHTVESGGEAVEFIDDQSTRLNNWGTRGFALSFGPDGTDWADLPLRIDIDPDADAAAIRWIPDNLIGGADRPHHGGPIRVLEDSGDPLVEIPAELVRFNLAEAKRVAAEYVETGQRPTSITWEPIA